jgi:predicted ATP-dependent serine protease
MKESTGFESLDIILKGGLAIGDLLSISSSAGIGKTALSNQLAINDQVYQLRVPVKLNKNTRAITEMQK